MTGRATSWGTRPRPQRLLAALAAAVLLGLGALQAQQPTPATPQTPGATAAPTQGRSGGPRPAPPAGAELFSTTCKVCHGDAGIGGVGPKLRGAKFTRPFVRQVMIEGRPGTMMPQYSKTFTTTQINQVAAYVASLQSPTGPAPGGLRGDAVAGESVFFMRNAARSCAVCHSLNGRGGRVGPDLAPRVARMTPRELFLRITVVPHRSTDQAYVTMKLTTRVGEILTGIKAGETLDSVLFYDTATLPPRLRTIRKTDVVSTERHNTSVMPNDYASRLTLQQLLDVVAYLKSASGAPAVITLNDVIN